MNLKEQLSEKIKTRDEARKLILDPYIRSNKNSWFNQRIKKIRKGNKYFN
jgi:hypothetical protein